MLTIQNKYKPKKYSDIIGNTKQIQYIKEWLDEYETIKEYMETNGLLKKSSKGRKKKVISENINEQEYMKRKGNLLITGNHGCGKSTIMSLILNDKKYEIINLNMIDSKIKIEPDLIYKLASENKETKKVLLIDELESVITLNDKNGVFSVIKENNYKRWLPIIIITNNQHNKQLNEIKKFSNEIKIYAPFQNEITRWITNICRNEKIYFEENMLSVFMEYCQNDMRKILIQLDELKINYGSTKITSEILDNFMKIMKKKDLDFDLFKATNEMLTNYKNIETCLELYETEKVLMPLMIHENYYKFIKSNKYSKILENLSVGDILENYIYGEQNWDLLDLHGIISCCIPSYLINKYSNNNKSIKIDFAADLNRTSVKKMNKKNIIKTNNSHKNIRNKSIDEFIYMGDIVNDNKKMMINNSNYVSNIIKINKLKINSKNIIKKI